MTLSEIKYGERKQSSLLQTSSRLHHRNNQVNDTTLTLGLHMITNIHKSRILIQVKSDNLPAKIHQVMSLIENHLYHGNQDA